MSSVCHALCFYGRIVDSLFNMWHDFQRKATEVRARRSDLKKIEDLGAILEEHLILDNRYTEHSTVGLAQQWDQLDQLGMRMQHNLEQQIQARNQSGVSEDALKEFSMMFKHFDKDKSGRLNQQEFKSCLRALGYDLPMVEEGQPDPEFEAILGKISVMCSCALLDIKYKVSTTVATGIFYYLHVGCAKVYLVITTLSLQRPVFDPGLICFGFYGGQNGTGTHHFSFVIVIQAMLHIPPSTSTVRSWQLTALLKNTYHLVCVADL